MSSAVNSCSFVGRLATDATLETTGSGTKLVHFTLAVQRSKDVTDFIPCTAWDSTAEFLTKYFHKGSAIAVRGRLLVTQTERDGAKRSFYDIRVDDVDFVPGTSNGSGSGGNDRRGGSSGREAGLADDEGPDEDDAPF